MFKTNESYKTFAQKLLYWMALVDKIHEAYENFQIVQELLLNSKLSLEYI